MLSLFLAMTGFVGGHFLLSARPVRTRLVASLGELAFLAVYSMVSAAFLVWAVIAYRAAPPVALWDLGEAGRWIAVIVMPFSLVLAVAGLTSRNPTLVGGERMGEQLLSLGGIVTVTRHPFLWGAAFWALAHLVANGDAASLVLFGGMAILALAGMAAIDAKRAAQLGEKWLAFSQKTSAVPFAVALRGETPVDWKGIGWWRLALGLVLYAALLASHSWLFGVSALPAG